MFRFGERHVHSIEHDVLIKVASAMQPLHSKFAITYSISESFKKCTSIFILRNR